MSAEILSQADGILTLKVSGTLTQPELLLVLTENFAGWERGGAWDDFSFSEHDARIERMAIVGERKWQDLALLFTAKGLRAFPIEYFEPVQLAAARAWLATNPL